MNYVVHVSSNANNGANADAFYVNANNDSSNANRNIGRHLAVICTIKINSFPLLGEYVNPMQFGRETEELGEQQR
jgi:hypothetical protein